MYKKTKLILSLLSLLITVFVGQSYASLVLSPINPAYQEYVKHQQVEKNSTYLGNRGYSPSEESKGSEEYKFMGLIPPVFDSSHIKTKSVVTNRSKSNGNATIPAQYDLRTEGKVTEIKDQGYYGTCWAFATMASLESSFINVGLGVQDLSERHLAWFAYNDESADKIAYTKLDIPDGYNATYDQGGNSYQSIALLSRWTGPVKEEECLYSGISKDSVSNDIKPFKQLRKALLLGNKNISGDIDNSDIKNALMSGQALYTAFCWFYDCYNADTFAYCCKDTARVNGHSVAIIGWDDNFAVSNFRDGNKPSKDGAWLIKNSWGSDWGNEGTFWISYEDVNMQTTTQFETNESTSYDKQYSYDPLGFVNAVGVDTSSVYSAAIFTADGVSTANTLEVIKAIGFYATDSDLTYNIEIYTGVTDNEPTSGRKVLSQSGTFTQAGYYTIPLDSDVIVKNNKKFSIVVKVDTTKDYQYLIPVEYVYKGYSDAATANPGETFYSTDGVEWNDMYEFDPTANICIKAFTTNKDAPPSSGCNTGFLPLVFLMGLSLVIIKKSK